MSQHALLDAIIASPNDDAARLVWADAVGGERGEFVVVQCDLARGGLSIAETVARRKRERELLETHGERWAKLDGLASSWEFRRGFVEAATVEAAVFVSRAAEILGAAPVLRSLRATGFECTVSAEDQWLSGVHLEPAMKELLTVPELARIDRLAICRAVMVHEPPDPPSQPYHQRYETGRGDDVATALVGGRILSRVNGLAFENSELTSLGVHALVASNQLAAIEALRLGRVIVRRHVDEPAPSDGWSDAIVAILRACPRLRSFDLYNPNLAAIGPHLPTLDELVIDGVTEDGLDQLAASRAGTSLRSLVLADSLLDRGAGSLAKLPRLESLELRSTIFGLSIPLAPQPSAKAFAALVLPALRRLRVHAILNPDDLLVIARAFGPQLELLDLRGVNPNLDVLRPLVAGEVLGGTQFDAGIRFL